MDAHARHSVALRQLVEATQKLAQAAKAAAVTGAAVDVPGAEDHVAHAQTVAALTAAFSVDGMREAAELALEATAPPPAPSFMERLAARCQPVAPVTE